MLLMIGRGNRSEIGYTIHTYEEANQKQQKRHDEIIESSSLQYWDINNSYRWAMSQKLLVNSFELIEEISQFNEDFIKNQNEEIYGRYFVEVGAQYLPRITRTLSKRVKLLEEEKLVTNLHDKNDRFPHIRNLKQALNHELILTKISQSD